MTIATADDAPLVVIADDDADIRALVSTRLQQAGYRTIEAADGLEALKSVIANRPDLLVLDVCMPGLDGKAVMRILAAEEGPTQRVLFVSAHGTVSDRVEGLDLGALDYLAKPFVAAELLARVRSAIRRD
jgi:two-component system response regulator MprA